jgi:hypothetical protein
MYDVQRKEPRYDVPDPCRQYLELRVKRDNGYVPAVIGNFSRNGILFECPSQFAIGDRTECVLKAHLADTWEVTFGIEVKYCYENNGSFIMGASIFAISKESWFDAFEELFDFIVVRQGK